LPGIHRGVVAFLLCALTGAGLAAAQALSPAPAASGPVPLAASRSPAASAPAQPGSARTRGTRLPDSLLARVGNGRDITVSRFRNAWDQLKPPERPDSLTPQTAREFLQLLIGKEALGEVALRERWVWNADDSSGYVALRDHLVLRAALDSALDAERVRRVAAGDSVPDEGGLGVLARDHLIAGLDLSFDAPLLERLARAFAAIPRPSRDSSLTAQLRVLGAMPQVEDSLLPRAIAQAKDQRYTVADLLDAWRHTNPVTRPRVQTADQVHDLACNGIFERVLRRDAARRRLVERPDIAQALAGRREYIAVTHLVAREVYAKIATDSVTLERHYREHADDWSLPLRIRLIRLVLADRAAAVQMRLRLANAAEAESLAERGARAGAAYRSIVSAESDSLLFAHALAAGSGAVVGPDSVRNGWAVARVSEMLPARRRSYAEARQLVYHDWYGKEGERLMEALIERARRGTHVVVHEPALAALTPPSHAH
jgi:hypothetical protein